MKKFKLVPLKHFEHLITEKKNSTEQEKEGHLNKKVDNERKLKDIIEQDDAQVSDTEVIPSFQYVTDMKNTPLKGGEGRQEKIPIFLPDAPSLPEFSRGTNLRKSYDDMSDILYSKDIPDEIKIKLYHIFRDRYENVRKPPRMKMDTDIENNNENEDNKDSRILERILARLPENKQDVGNTIGDILYNEDAVRWSKYGYITSPPTPREQMDLNKLIKIIIYRNTGTKKEIETVYNIINPFFNNLEPYILNRNLIKKHDGMIGMRRMTKYVAW